MGVRAKVLAQPEAMSLSVELEGANVTSSPFTPQELKKSEGHSENFLGNVLPIPFPRLSDPDDEEAHRYELVRKLDYEHFSIMFDARKKQALVAVVDIDGRRLRQINRRSTDSWYPDPRIAKEDQPQSRHFGKPDPRFGGKKSQFAFNHLVRRLDPCWDSPHLDAEPEKPMAGNADVAELQTFFLTNASPQAESRNQPAWSDLEDLVMDDLCDRLKIRAVIVAGPIFDDVEPLKIVDEMPVPREYFKIVAWRSEGRLATVGWVQQQPHNVMSPTLEAIIKDKQYKPGMMWLRSISEIAKATKLDLSTFEPGATYPLRKSTVRLESIFALSGPFARNADDLLMTNALPLDDRVATDDDIAPMLACRELEEETLEDPIKLEGLGGTAVFPISTDAYKIIVNFEAGGRRYYDNYHKKQPVLPNEKSGITIGFGYDLGYVTPQEFKRDWAALSDADLTLLGTVVGLRGKRQTDAEMRAALVKVKGVVIEWEIAEAVYRAGTLSKFEALTRAALPNANMLSGDSFGALVYLTFNRGASYHRHPKPGERDRWIQMRVIRDAMTLRNFRSIPDLIPAMIPLWTGTSIQTDMRRRRTDEAALFRKGLDVAASLPMGSIASGEAVAPDDLDDAERWPDLTDDDVAIQATDALAVPMLEGLGVAWASDERSPDYAHLARPAAVGTTFALAADDIEWLVRSNDFPIDEAGERVLFGLRGAMIVAERPAIILKDLRPDHSTARCVLGVWNRMDKTVSVFPGSTVANSGAVRNWMDNRDAGNILATGGFYGYIFGTNNGTPGWFLLRETTAIKRTVVVRRSNDDLTYDLGDLADLCKPGDNIHPTYRRNLANFSSVGCQTVVGMATPADRHDGPWAEFRRSAGLPKPNGTAFRYLLLTGAEARIASKLRRNGLAVDRVSRSRNERLRFGSRGPRVRRLQERLGIANPDGDFGPVTAMRLHARQRTFTGVGSDGIYTSALDEALGWAVF